MEGVPTKILGRATSSYSINVQPVLPTLLQNELNSDIVRFTSHVRTCLKTKKGLRIFFSEMGKRATSLFNLFRSNFANSISCSVFFFCCPFDLTFG